MESRVFEKARRSGTLIASCGKGLRLRVIRASHRIPLLTAWALGRVGLGPDQGFDSVTRADELLGKVAADESRCARDQHLH